MGRGVVALACVALLGWAGVAAAAKDPQLAYLERTLKRDMTATFKKQAPSLTLTTLSCRLPTNGTVAHCTAHFTVTGIKGYYPVTAKIRENGQLTWTTASPKCFNARTGKAISC